MPPVDESKNKSKMYAALGVVVIIVIVALVFLLKSESDDSKEILSGPQNALGEVGVEMPVVAPHINPLKTVLPAENPIKKTNPFKNEYANPFE